MDHKLACAGFTPPVPMRMDAYLDQVTRGKVTNLGWLSIFDLDEALRQIEARPTLAEQAALLGALDDRFVAQGRARGWLAPPPDRSDGERADLLTRFVVEDLLGIKGAAVDKKIFDEFKGRLKDALKPELNRTGKRSLKTLQLLYELSAAKNGQEAASALAKAGISELTSWLAKPDNMAWLARSALKAGDVSPVVRNRLVKLIATRLTWLEVGLSRLAWVSPWLLALELFFTVESTATDAMEQRLTFLSLYGRLFATRSQQFGRIIDACAGDDWRYRLPPPQALATAIHRMP